MMGYLEEGFNKIYKDDLEAQNQYLQIIADDIRHCNVDVFTDNFGVFIPNNEYMTQNFGDKIKAFEYTSDGRCVWNSAVIFPIYDVLDEVVAILGYFPLNKLKEDAGPSYKVSSKEVFDRKKFFFSPKGGMRKSLEDGYVVLTDGVFDTLQLNQIGINAMALMGSYLSKEHIAYLTLLDRVYLAVDNDRAGVNLLSYLRKQIKSAKGIRFNKYKDIDDVLKSEHREEFLNKLKNSLKRDYPGDIIITL